MSEGEVLMTVGDDSSDGILRLRFPDGEVEIRWNSGELPVGVLVRSRGALWRVGRHETGAVFLEPASPENQAAHGPVVKPTPLGDDESVLLETISEV
jgi:hypothetical protein